MTPEQTVRQFLVDTFLLGRNTVLDVDQSLIKAGVLDSTGVLELVGFLENAFQIQIADQDLLPENLDSIRRIVAFVNRKRPRIESDCLSGQVASEQGA